MVNRGKLRTSVTGKRFIDGRFPHAESTSMLFIFLHINILVVITSCRFNSNV